MLLVFKLIKSAKPTLPLSVTLYICVSVITGSEYKSLIHMKDELLVEVSHENQDRDGMLVGLSWTH